jgi:hypothetical protein
MVLKVNVFALLDFAFVCQISFVSHIILHAIDSCISLVFIVAMPESHRATSILSSMYFA